MAPVVQRVDPADKMYRLEFILSAGLSSLLFEQAGPVFIRRWCRLAVYQI